MADVLKGNFQTRKKVKVDPEKDESLEERFEREALMKLSGSVAFVSKKSVKWETKEGDS